MTRIGSNPPIGPSDPSSVSGAKPPEDASAASSAKPVEVARDGVDEPEKHLPILTRSSEPNPNVDFSRRATLGTDRQVLSAASHELSVSAEARQTVLTDPNLFFAAAGLPDPGAASSLERVLPGQGEPPRPDKPGFFVPVPAVAVAVAWIWVAISFKFWNGGVADPPVQQPGAGKSWQSEI